MNIYESIKAAISVKQSAEHYGLKVSRNGMACCPFHNDRHPSLKLNEEYFFCFGCGAKGDVIDFVARLFDLSSYEAAQRLAADFGISTEPGQPVAVPHKLKHPYIRQFREDEMLCFRVLTDYLHLLEDWKVWYAPKTPDDALDDRFLPPLFFVLFKIYVGIEKFRCFCHAVTSQKLSSDNILPQISVVVK